MSSRASPFAATSGMTNCGSGELYTSCNSFHKSAYGAMIMCSGLAGFKSLTVKSFTRRPLLIYHKYVCLKGLIIEK